MKAFLAPILTLCALLGLAMWNCGFISGHTDRWSAQLEETAELAMKEEWDGVRESLDKSYQDWTRYQTYLHIAERHDAIDDAETMYRRAAAFARMEEPAEFQAEVADLIDQLRLLAELERFSLENVL